MKKIILILTLVLTLCGCTTQNTEINYQQANNLIKEGAILIDVRTLTEYNTKHIENAISIPLNEIDKNIKEQIPNKNTKIILYCQSGKRSEEAQNKLINLGYKQVYNLGSINNWKD